MTQDGTKPFGFRIVHSFNRADEKATKIIAFRGREGFYFGLLLG